METDGQTISPGGQEYVDFINQIKKLRKEVNPIKAKVPSSYAGRKVGVLWKHHNFLDPESSNSNSSYNYFQHMYIYYSALKAAGCRTLLF